MIKIIGVPTDEMKRAADAAFVLLSLSGEAELELNYVSAEEIRSLNKETRGLDRETDVLSFPMLIEIKPFTKDNYPLDVNPDTGRVSIGSVVICKEVAERQAAEYGHSVTREMTYLFLHGLLHVLGYDHIEEKDRLIMREKEETILREIGVQR